MSSWDLEMHWQAETANRCQVLMNQASKRADLAREAAKRAQEEDPR